MLLYEVLVEGLYFQSLGFNLQKRKIVLESDVIKILGRVARSKSEIYLPKVGAFGNIALVIFVFHQCFKIFISK